MNYFSEDELRCQCGCGVYKFNETVLSILNSIRRDCGFPLPVTSGYRCLDLNRRLKSSDTSQHVSGQAADIELPGISNYDLGVWIKNNCEYDTVLLEFYKEGIPSSGWVHVSYVEGNNRKRALIFDGKQYKSLE